MKCSTVILLVTLQRFDLLVWLVPMEGDLTMAAAALTGDHQSS
jgi:hypothetical protein